MSITGTHRAVGASRREQNRESPPQPPQPPQPQSVEAMTHANIADELLDPGIPERDRASALLLLEQAQKLCVSLFFREAQPARILGITSAIQGEGKSALALTLSRLLARDASRPVALIECNWEHASLHRYFAAPLTPGLAEWLGGRCDRNDIRQQVQPNLHLITAGEGRMQEVRLVQRLRRGDGLEALLNPDELAVVELPPVLTAAYCAIAACLVDTSIMVVRAGVTPQNTIARACLQLQHVPIEGLVLNRVHSHIPRWLQQIL